MRKAVTINLTILLLTVYTETVYGCAFRKLVDAALEKKAIHAARTKSEDLIEDPVPPEWAATAAERRKQVRLWETAVLDEAEKRWTALGVHFQRVPYKGGEALRVLETGDAPLNSVFAQAQERARKTGYSFELVFSPESLVREWPEKKVHFLVGGSFRGDTNTIHLPFSSVEEKDLNGTFHHEFLHAVFDYYREHGQNSAFHGQFRSRDGQNPMWKGTSYTEYMSLEELATFPLNLRLYELRLKEISKEPDLELKNKKVKRFVEWISGHVLTNTVNATHASTSIGHILRHLSDGLGDVRVGAKMERNKNNGRISIAAVFNWANINYRIELTEESLQEILPDLKKENKSDASKMSPELANKLRTVLIRTLEKQHEMARKAADSADELMRETITLKEKSEGKYFTADELSHLSELLINTRRATVPYIRLKPE